VSAISGSPSYRVVVTDRVFPDVDTEREVLGEIGAELLVAEGKREAVLAAAEDADALLTTYFALDAEAIGRLRHCRIIARYGIGVDNIDLDAAKAAGIVVTNVPDYCVDEVAAHALALLLALLRRLPAGDRLVRAGEWGVEGVRPLHRLSETTVGIVGFGRIGRRLADLLRPLGPRLLVHDPYVEQTDDAELVDLEELLQHADAVSLHVPLSTQTRGLIGERELGLMRPSAVLVNTSRGPLVQLNPLLAALREGRLAGAGLDVFEQEPPNPAAFADVQTLLVSPHVAFYSEEAINESQSKAATQVVKVLSGQGPDYKVN
jgi:D-3-phosphoglycerate dehydrogenase / 2-oxoglutarate reductase